mgnify:FL=1
MAELNNTAPAVGSYNSVPTSLVSNTSVINIVEGLTLVKDVDKKMDKWYFNLYYSY